MRAARRPHATNTPTASAHRSVSVVSAGPAVNTRAPSQTPLPEDLIDYATCARLTSLPLGTLYAMVSRKEIPHYRPAPRTVRFSRAEIEAFIRASYQPATRGGR